MRKVKQVTPNFTVYPPGLPPFQDKKMTAGFVKKALEFFGADVSKIRKNWCFTAFAREYPEYRECFERLIQLATTGNPPYIAFLMAVNKISTPEFAEAILRQCAETGVGNHPDLIAAWMVQDSISDLSFESEINAIIANQKVGKA